MELSIPHLHTETIQKIMFKLINVYPPRYKTHYIVPINPMMKCVCELHFALKH
jgi:hypothetical protein